MARTKQFNEKEVLNKAMELFWKKGAHATSIQDLVSHLGINNTNSNFIKTLFENEKSVKKGFKKLFDKAIEETLNDTARKDRFVVNTTKGMIPGDSSIHAVLMQNKEMAEKLFMNYVQSGIESGEIEASKNAKNIGLMLFAFYNGLRVVAKVDSDPKKLTDMVEAGLSVLD